MTIALDVRDAHKSFGATCALNGAQLALQGGEWLGLLGPNGAGKTTLVRAIAGGVRLDGGAITLLGELLGDTPNGRQRIWDMLGELRAQGASLLLTTHQLDEAQSVCDRIVIIDHGRTIASGTLTELLRDTIGTRRSVTLTLEGPPPASLGERGYSVQDDRTVRKQVTDIARDLPQLLEDMHAAGVVVRDLHIDTPSLQAVFLHLTGRNLRE